MVFGLLGNFGDFILYGIIYGDRDVGVSQILFFVSKFGFDFQKKTIAVECLFEVLAYSLFFC